MRVDKFFVGDVGSVHGSHLELVELVELVTKDAKGVPKDVSSYEGSAKSAKECKGKRQ